MIVSSDLATILKDPLWLPHGLKPTSDSLSFIRVERDQRLALPSLEGEALAPVGCPEHQTSLRAIPPLLDRSHKPRLNVIWHTAFCCSTLLARLIEQPGLNQCLREPDVAVSLALAKRAEFFARRETEHLPDTVFRLLTRRFAPSEAVTLKPSPIANYLFRDAAALTEGKMLVLYSDCASFVRAVAKRGVGGGGYARRLFAIIKGDGNEQSRWPLDKLFALADLHVAAVLWHLNIAEFARSWTAVESGRVASLDCDALLDSPVQTLEAVDDFLELGLGRQRVLEAVEREMSRDAKDLSRAYSPGARQREAESITASLKADIEAVVESSYQSCKTTRGVPLPAPLVKIDKEYV